MPGRCYGITKTQEFKKTTIESFLNIFSKNKTTFIKQKETVLLKK